MPKLDPRLRRVRRATPPEPMPPSLRVPQAGRRRHPRRYPHSRSHPCTRHRCRTHGRRPSSCHRHGFHWDFSTLCMGGPHDVQLGDFRPPPTAVLSVIGWTIGAGIAFLAARHLGRPILEKFVSLEAVDAMTDRIPEDTRFLVIVPC